MNWRLLFTLLAFVICLPLPAPPYPKTRFCGGIVHHFGRHLNYRVERRLPFNDVETELATPYKWGPHRETIYDLERVIDGTRITLSGEPIRAHPFPTYSLVCRRNDTGEYVSDANVKEDGLRKERTVVGVAETNGSNGEALVVADAFSGVDVYGGTFYIGGVAITLVFGDGTSYRYSLGVEAEDVIEFGIYAGTTPYVRLRNQHIAWVRPRR